MENEKHGAAEAFCHVRLWLTDIFLFFSFSFEIALANIFCWLEILKRVEQSFFFLKWLFQNFFKKIFGINRSSSLSPTLPSETVTPFDWWLSLLDSGSKFWKLLGDVANEVAGSSLFSIETGSGIPQTAQRASWRLRRFPLPLSIHLISPRAQTHTEDRSQAQKWRRTSLKFKVSLKK